MTVALKPYSRMKETGFECLGSVPTHWALVKLGQIGVFSKGSGGTKEDTTEAGVPCVRYGDLYTSHNYRIEKAESCISLDRAQDYTPARHGDLLFAGSGETIEEIGKSAVNLIRSRSCCGGDVILFRPKRIVDPRYMGYATDCASARTQKARMGRGITVMHIYGSELKRMNLVLPPVREQTAIARFLDYIDRRITRHIRAKEKLIVLLEEYKQAVIRQAVTGQIDVRTGTPYKEYKDSGVEWLGTVPGHWDVKRLKSVTTIASGQVDPQHEDHRSKILIAPNHIISGRGEIGFLETADQQGADSGKYIVQRGDVLYSKIRPHLRKAAIAPVDGLCSADMYPIQASAEEISNRYLLHLLLSDQTTKYTVECSLRVAMPKINRESLGSCWIAFPKVEEQLAILSWIHEKTSGVDTFVTTAKGMVALLQEYRTRLIADVVTGKLDVRETAANIPDRDPLECTPELDGFSVEECKTNLEQSAGLEQFAAP